MSTGIGIPLQDRSTPPASVSSVLNCVGIWKHAISYSTVLGLNRAYFRGVLDWNPCFAEPPGENLSPFLKRILRLHDYGFFVEAFCRGKYDPTPKYDPENKVWYETRGRTIVQFMWPRNSLHGNNMEESLNSFRNGLREHRDIIIWRTSDHNWRGHSFVLIPPPEPDHPAFIINELTGTCTRRAATREGVSNAPWEDPTIPVPNNAGWDAFYGEIPKIGEEDPLHLFVSAQSWAEPLNVLTFVEWLAVRSGVPAAFAEGYDWYELIRAGPTRSSVRPS